MIHLCIDARMARFSGIGTCIRELVPLLNQSPFKVSLLVKTKNTTWDANIQQIPFSAPIYSIQEQLLFPLKIPKCDLFWSPHYNVPISPTRARKKIVTIHDACHLALPQYLSFLERIYAKKMMHKALHHSDQVITDSTFSKEQLHHYLGKPKQEIRIILNGINSERFYKVTSAQQQEAIRKKYQLSEIFVLFVGNLKPHKNLSGLMRAFDLLPPRYKLVLVGKCKGLRNQERIQGDRILELGEVPDEDLPSLYSLADLFILPSFYEGFGLPPLEAMCCQCPTIVSNTSSLPEVCQEASLYIDPTNPKKIAETILLLSTNNSLKQDLIKKGLQRVQVLNWTQTANAYRKLLIEVHNA